MDLRVNFVILHFKDNNKMQRIISFVSESNYSFKLFLDSNRFFFYYFKKYQIGFIRLSNLLAFTQETVVSLERFFS